MATCVGSACLVIEGQAWSIDPIQKRSIVWTVLVFLPQIRQCERESVTQEGRRAPPLGNGGVFCLES